MPDPPEGHLGPGSFLPVTDLELLFMRMNRWAAISCGILVLVSCERSAPADSDMESLTSGPRTVQAESGSHALPSGLDSLPFDFTDDVVAMEDAPALAEAGLRYFWPWMRTNVERIYGGPLDIESLVARDEVLLAHTPYASIDRGLPDHLRRLLGSYYLVTFEDGSGRPAVSVAVSLHATNVDLVDGELSFPDVYGNEFRIGGISAGSITEPRDVVDLVGLRTGAVVHGDPVLVTGGYDDLPHRGAWRVELERELELLTRRDGTRHRRRSVWVTSTGALALPDPHGRRIDSIAFRGVVYRARLHPSMAVDLVPVKLR